MKTVLHCRCVNTICRHLVFTYHFVYSLLFLHMKFEFCIKKKLYSGSPRTGDLSTSQSSQDSSTLPITSEIEVHSDNGERAEDG